MLVAAASASAGADTIGFTTDEGTWLSLDADPGGESLLFELLGDIYRLPVEGGEAVPLLTGRAFQSQPRYSPDGASIVYISDESGSDNVWISRADGRGARALTDRRRVGMLSPTWSADGAAVYVTVVPLGMPPGVADLWRYDVDTGEGLKVVENANGPPAFLVSAPAPGPYGAEVSPDGDVVYYTAVTPRQHGSRDGPSSAIFRLESATGATERVPLQGDNAMRPALSPNGSLMVYAAMREGGTGLRLRDMETGTERWLSEGIQRNQLEGRATRDLLPNYSFSADGDAVFVEIDGRIHRLGLDGSDVEVPFTATVSLEVTPRLRFPRRVETGPVRARRLQHLAVAPDGRMAFSSMARIFVAAADGGSPDRLTRTSSPREFMPAWSPDGRWVAYVTWGAAGGHLWKAAADGSGEPVRLSREAAFWADPVWTPDGGSVVALTAPLGSEAAPREIVPPDAMIVEVPAAGGEPRAMAPSGGLRHPHFAGDPAGLYLSSVKAGLVSLAGDGSFRTPQARLSPQAGAGHLWLSPDGSRVAALAGGRISLFDVPAGGFGGRELTPADGTPVALGGDWGTLAWSPADGRLVWGSGMTVGGEDAGPLRLEVTAPRPVPSGSIVLRGARIVTISSRGVIEDGEIVVTGNRIAALGPRGSVEIPEGAAVFDVGGHTIVPGFVDVHAHLSTKPELLEPESTASFANLALGVTTVSDPQSSVDVFDVADIIEADDVPGPRVYSTGPGVGLPSPMARDLRSLDEARAALDRYVDDYRTGLIKSYMPGNRMQKQWIITAARERGLMVTAEGAADTKADLTHAMDGFSGNEHALPVAPIRSDVIELLARTGMTYTPTLVVSFGGALPIYRLMAEERPHTDPGIERWFAAGELYAKTSSRVLWFPPEAYNDRDTAAGAKAILEAGGRVALGGHGEVQGLSAHWEMGLLAGGGMSPHDVLRCATIFGAELLGLDGDLGSLEQGKLADLVVLERDPLADIEATRSIRWVMRDGNLYDAETLDELWPEAVPFESPWWLGRPEASTR